MRWSIWGCVLLIAAEALLSFRSVSMAADNTSFITGRDAVEVWRGEIAGAKDSLLIVTLKLTTHKALKPLLEAHQGGVKVRLLLDGKEAAAPKSLARKARKAGIEVLVWPTDSLGELHAKFTVIDARELVAGSFNLSAAAAKSNTECVVIVTEPSAVESAVKSFYSLTAQAKPLNVE